MPLIDLEKLGPLEIAEAVVIITGATLGLGVLVYLFWRRQWTQALRLPVAVEHRLQPLDILLALAAVVILPSLFVDVGARLDGVLLPTPTPIPATTTQVATALPTTSQATTAPADTIPQRTPLEIAGMTLGQFAGAVVLLLIGYRRFRGGLPGWGFNLRKLPLQCLGAVAAYLTIWAICFGLLRVTLIVIPVLVPNYQLPEHSTILTLQRDDIALWVSLTTMAGTLLLAPLAEELLFRGILQPALTKAMQSQWRAILVSGIVFGFFHYPLIHTIPALIFFGIALGYAYAKTRSLTFVILLHMVFNAKTILWVSLAG